jgi:hypothetical protein
VQVKKNGTAVGNPLIALGRPVLEAGNSYTLNLTVLYDEVKISSVQLTDWVTVDTIEGGEAEKALPSELIINLQDYSSEADVRSAIYDYCNKVEGDKRVTVVGALNDWSICTVLGSNTSYDGYKFKITHLNLDGITDLTEFPSYCFTKASTLKQISAKQVITIGMFAFKSLSNLIEINFPSAKTIYSQAFKSATSLTTIDLPSATYINSNAFGSCSSLTTVSIPRATTFVGSIFYPTTTENIDLTLNESQSENVEGNTWTYTSNGTVVSKTFKSITLVNVVNLQDYDSAEAVREAIQNSTNVILEGQLNGMDIANIFRHDPECKIISLNLDGITDLTNFRESTFLDFNTLEKLSASQVINLGDYCCAYLDNLKEVNLPSVEYVGQGAFANCLSLTNISLPKAETIEIMGFYSCSSLTSVYIPNAAEFGNHIFGGCNTENIDLTLNESQRAYVDMTTYTWFCNQDSYPFKSISFE